MSEPLFETLSQEEWVEQGGGGAAERGIYTTALLQVVNSGERYFRIPTDRGPFQGKKASSVATALKNARDAKSAPAEIARTVGEGENTKPAIRITSQGGNKENGSPGVVFIENLLVGAAE